MREEEADEDELLLDSPEGGREPEADGAGAATDLGCSQEMLRVQVNLALIPLVRPFSLSIDSCG